MGNSRDLDLNSLVELVVGLPDLPVRDDSHACEGGRGTSRRDGAAAEAAGVVEGHARHRQAAAATGARSVAVDLLAVAQPGHGRRGRGGHHAYEGERFADEGFYLKCNTYTI